MTELDAVLRELTSRLLPYLEGTAAAQSPDVVELPLVMGIDPYVGVLVTLGHIIDENIAIPETLIADLGEVCSNSSMLGDTYKEFVAQQRDIRS